MLFSRFTGALSRLSDVVKVLFTRGFLFGYKQPAARALRYSSSVAANEGRFATPSAHGP